MRSILFLCLCLSIFAAACTAQRTATPLTSPAATQPVKNLTVQDVLGEWFGESKCTGKNPYCHDEVVRYRFSEISGDAKKVHLAADKQVNGEWELMGEFDFTVDPAKSTLTAEFIVPRTGGKAVWAFTVAGDKIDGTLSDEPEHVITRNIHVARKK